MAISSRRPLRAGVGSSARSLTARSGPSKATPNKATPSKAGPAKAESIQPAPASMNATAVKVAADRVGWVLAPGRAEQIAASALPVIELFNDVQKIIDFDSDPLAFLVIRDAVKYREGA